MCEEPLTIPVAGGNLVYYLNDNGEAVPVDYIGTGRILIIPPVLPCADHPGDVVEIASAIPDEAFSSCTSVEYIVDMSGCSFGLFTFTHCQHLASVISVDTDNTAISEFSFADEHNAPKRIPHTVLVSEDAEGSILPARLFVQHLISRYAAADDVTSLIDLASLGNIGRSLRTAIERGNMRILSRFDSLGLLLEACPFAYSIGTAIKYGADEVFRFLLQRRMFAVNHDEGSALFAAAVQNSLPYTEALLSAGYDPYALTPEWNGERPVLEFARNTGRADIAHMIQQYQLRKP